MLWLQPLRCVALTPCSFCRRLREAVAFPAANWKLRCDALLLHCQLSPSLAGLAPRAMRTCLWSMLPQAA